jgi:hypothetical protein
MSFILLMYIRWLISYIAMTITKPCHFYLIPPGLLTCLRSLRNTTQSPGLKNAILLYTTYYSHTVSPALIQSPLCLVPQSNHLH